MPINNQLLYLEDPNVLEFEASITETQILADGRQAVYLDHSYFYPTGGGQEHDTGLIGQALVIDVFKQGQPATLVHVIDRPVPLGPVVARIDGRRRQRNSQHHTAQHLLTQCFLKLQGLDTLSANINGFTPSTLDLPFTNLPPDVLVKVENLANQIIYQDLPVHTYFVTAQDLAQYDLRRAPQVTGDIRIVEIDGYDYTPCGGTHCQSTGQIGILKIVRLEKQNERLRVHFVAGWQALELFQSNYDTLSRLAAHLSVGQAELLTTIQHQSELLQKTQKELAALSNERLSREADRLSEQFETINGQPIVLAFYKARSANDLRLLGSELSKRSRLLSILVSVEASKLSLVIACGEASALNASELLRRLLTPFNGRGGGDARLAQGGGKVSHAQDLESYLRAEIFTLLASNNP